jgi:PAS domain S-box-containing protein
VTLTSAVELRDTRLRQALDGMPHKVWMVRMSGPAIYYNQAMRDFAGEVLKLPDRGSRERALIHPDDLAGFLRARDQGLVAKSDWTNEARLKAPDGSYRWHRLHFSVVRASGTPEAWLATATDIDDLKRALIATSESEERLRLAAQAAQFGIYGFDLRTHEHTWSPELKAIFGLAPGDAVPGRIVEWIHPDDRGRFEARREASLDPGGAGIFEDDHRIVRRDGSVRWVFVKGRVSFAGADEQRVPLNGLGFVLDVTERKLAEQALAQSEARYGALVEHANDIIMMLDLEGRVLSINPAVRDILGYQPGELIGRRVCDLVPHDQVPCEQALPGQPGAVARYELAVAGKQGQVRVLGINAGVIADGSGNPVAVHCIARDITERKEADSRQSLLVRELQHRSKNLLAVVQSIATNTLKRSSNVAVALEMLIGRIHALAHAQDFVAAGAQGGVPLRQLLKAELDTFGGQALLEGEEMVVGGAFAQTFALVVHELATNAVKYGAFSVPSGRVLVQWSFVGEGEGAALEFAWVERNGPGVHAPETAGFGTLLMATLGDARTLFAEHGFEYRCRVPLAEAMRGSA